MISLKELQEKKRAKEAELTLTKCPNNSKEIQEDIIKLNNQIAELLKKQNDN